jgi:hypothetical protein
MPALLSPGRGPTEVAPGSGLPAFLYESVSSPTPYWSRVVDTAPSPSSPLPREPRRIEAPVGDPPVAPPAGIVPKAAKAPQLLRPAIDPKARAKASDSPLPPGRAVFRRRWIGAIAAAAAVLLVGAGIAGFALISRNGKEPSTTSADQPGNLPAAPAIPARRLKLLVPAYFYPGGEGMTQWDKLLKAPDPAAVIIIANKDSGPGKAPDHNYATVIARARQKGFPVIGYVSTRRGTRPVQETKGDIERWLLFYPGICGIFFDEQASFADKIDYYTDLYNYTKKERGLSLVVNNPGTICPEEYVAQPTADVVCLIESTKDFSDFQPLDWMKRYEPARFAGLFPKIDDVVKMQHYIRWMVAKRVGHGYITDGEGENPWGRLPSYWDAEVEAVKQVNAK